MTFEGHRYLEGELAEEISEQYPIFHHADGSSVSFAREACYAPGKFSANCLRPKHEGDFHVSYTYRKGKGTSVVSPENTIANQSWIGRA